MSFEVVGDVLGDEIDGEELDGDELVGARFRPRGRMIARRPGWRAGRLAPGVQAPAEGLVPLPLRPDAQGGVWSVALGASTTINWEGRPQKPFRGERLLTQVARSGAAAVIPLIQTIFIGTDLQMAELGGMSAEFFQANAFGVRLTLQQAEPGQLIRVSVNLSSAVAGVDTLTLNMMILGRIVH